MIECFVMYHHMLRCSSRVAGIEGYSAVLQKIHRPPPYLAQGWGLRDDIPESDSFIARRLAEKFDVLFLFCSYDNDGFIENAARCVIRPS